MSERNILNQIIERFTAGPKGRGISCGDKVALAVVADLKDIASGKTKVEPRSVLCQSED